jgi:hypothetical protein
MLFSNLADDIYPYAGPIGLAVGIAVGLHYYSRGKSEDATPATDPRPVEVEKRTCPHCQARFNDVGDALCPVCREPLDD